MTISTLDILYAIDMNRPMLLDRFLEEDPSFINLAVSIIGTVGVSNALLNAFNMVIDNANKREEEKKASRCIHVRMTRIKETQKNKYVFEDIKIIIL